MRQSGTVLWFKLDRGFGFIRTNVGQSLFFHLKNVREGYLLEAGDAVEYVVGPSKKAEGKLECFDVLLVARAARVAAGEVQS